MLKVFLLLRRGLCLTCFFGAGDIVWLISKGLKFSSFLPLSRMQYHVWGVVVVEVAEKLVDKASSVVYHDAILFNIRDIHYTAILIDVMRYKQAPEQLRLPSSKYLQPTEKITNTYF